MIKEQARGQTYSAAPKDAPVEPDFAAMRPDEFVDWFTDHHILLERDTYDALASAMQAYIQAQLGARYTVPDFAHIVYTMFDTVRPIERGTVNAALQSAFAAGRQAARQEAGDAMGCGGLRRG